MSLISDLPRGLDYLSLGYRLLGTPGVKPLLVGPLLLTVIIYGGALALTLPPVLSWIGEVGDGMPQWAQDWLGWLVTVLQWLLGAVLVLVVGWIGMLLAGVLASPFYGRISALVEQRLTGRTPSVERSLAAEIWAGVSRELHKLMWTLPRMLGLLVLGIIPVVNVIASPLSFLFGAWVMSAQFSDFAPENRGLEFADTRAALAARRGLALGFGAPTALGIAIPLLNLLVAPCAVAGGTAMWLAINDDWDGREGL